jgi:hypothetical protein
MWRRGTDKQPGKVTHHGVASLDCPPKPRFDGLPFGLEIPIVGRRDSRAVRFQEFSQPLKRRPGSPSALSIGFEFIQDSPHSSVRSLAHCWQYSDEHILSRRHLRLCIKIRSVRLELLV